MGLLGQMVAGAVGSSAGAYRGILDQRAEDRETKLEAIRKRNLERLKQTNRKKLAEHESGLRITEQKEQAMLEDRYTDKQVYVDKNGKYIGHYRPNMAPSNSMPLDVYKEVYGSDAEDSEDKPDSTVLARINREQQKILGEDFYPNEWYTGDSPTQAKIEQINKLRASEKLSPLVLDKTVEKQSFFGFDRLNPDERKWRLVTEKKKTIADGEDKTAQEKTTAGGKDKTAQEKKASKEKGKKPFTEKDVLYGLEVFRSIPTVSKREKFLAEQFASNEALAREIVARWEAENKSSAGKKKKALGSLKTDKNQPGMLMKPAKQIKEDKFKESRKTGKPESKEKTIGGVKYKLIATVTTGEIYQAADGSMIKKSYDGSWIALSARDKKELNYVLKRQ